MITSLPSLRDPRVCPSSHWGYSRCIEEREEEPEGREVRGEFAETIEASIHLLVRKNDMHRTVESGNGELGGNRFAFRCFPIVDAPESVEVI